MVQGQKANYQNTIIYKIVCNDLNIKDCYVGHTTNWIKRKYKHKQSCNNVKEKNHNLNVYKFIRENGGWDNWSMIEICKYPCNDKREAESEERKYYELLNSILNTRRPIRSKEEKKIIDKENHKKYYEKNKEKYNKYYEKNKDKHIEIYKKNKEKINEKFTCECGGSFTKINKFKHFKTKKHQKYLENK